MIFPTPLSTQLSPNYFFDFGALFISIGLLLVFLSLQSVSEDWQITILKKIESDNQIEIRQNKQLDQKLNMILSIIKSSKK